MRGSEDGSKLFVSGVRYLGHHEIEVAGKTGVADMSGWDGLGYPPDLVKAIFLAGGAMVPLTSTRFATVSLSVMSGELKEGAMKLGSAVRLPRPRS